MIRRIDRPAAFLQTLEPRLLLSGANGGIEQFAGYDFGQPTAIIAAGDPNGTPSDSPANHVDPNTTTSPYAGVGSVYMQTSRGGYIGSAAAISPTHILTAGHNVDMDSNGQVDVATGNFSFFLNYGGDLTHRIYAKTIHLHPDYTGFSNPTVNDDIAVIELSEPLPAGVPYYPLFTDNFVGGTEITMVGYGTSGDAVNGYYINPEFDVKRVGWQNADVSYADDEGAGLPEVFRFDMDGAGYNFMGGGSLGNDVESHIGGGDSGGPSFVIDAAGELAIFGVNTFSFGYYQAAPKFGSGGGGMIVSAYSDWIGGILGTDAGGGGGGGGSDGGGGGTTNAAPVANDDAATANRKGRASFNVLANDVDPDGDALFIENFTQPANGTISVASDGSVSYAANGGFSGVDTFTYTASDGLLTSNVATVTVNVGGGGGGGGRGGPKNRVELISPRPLVETRQVASIFSSQRVGLDATGLADDEAIAV